MSINIASQFKLNAYIPIDSRIVASGSTARGAIQFKYDGLRVFDTSDRITYTWNESVSSWQNSDITATGQANYMTRWATSTGLTSSGIYYQVGSNINKGKVGINTSSPQGILQINSDSGSSQPFVIHKGSSTLLAYNFFNNGNDQYFDFTVGSGAIRFINDGSIDFLTRSTNTVAMNSSNEVNLAFRIQNPGGRAFLFRDLVLSGNTLSPQSALYLRSQSVLSTSALPDVVWYNDDNTGIFHPSVHQIGFSIQGTQRARLTQTGLLLGGGGTLQVPANKLHLDNGNSQASYIQFTAGTTTGTGAAAGFLVGVNAQGFPVLQSATIPISTVIGTKHRHKLEPNSFTIYSDSDGVASSDITGVNPTRVIRSTHEKSVSASSPQNALLIGLSVPASSLCSLEVTFVTILQITSSLARQFKTQKLLISFSVSSAGVILSQNTGATSPAGGDIATSGHDIKTLTSQSATNIGKGYLNYQNGSGSGASFEIFQQVGMGLSVSYTSRTVIDFKLIVNKL